MKKLLLKLAIWILDKVEDKVMIDLDGDSFNDFTELKDKITLKLKQLQE